jgi:ankyrin repeat protein
MLGGTTTANLNFPISKDGFFLLLIAAAKGNVEMLNLMLNNQTLDINKQDKYGVNAFWIAAFYGKIEFMKKLKENHADIYAVN